MGPRLVAGRRWQGGGKAWQVPSPSLSSACSHTAFESVTVQDMLQTQVRKKKG